MLWSRTGVVLEGELQGEGSQRDFWEEKRVCRWSMKDVGTEGESCSFALAIS